MTDTHSHGPASADKDKDQKNGGHSADTHHHAHTVPNRRVEESDYLSHSTKVAAIMAEIRALSGQVLGATPHTPRFDPLRPTPITEADAKHHLERIASHLFVESRRGALHAIQERMHERFRAILATRRPAGGHHGHEHGPEDGESLSNSLLIGQSVLDAVYEEIKDVDPIVIATNIASNIHNNEIRAYYFNDVTNSLTPEGIKLLDRFRRGNTNPARVILAFSAALDPYHFNPEVPGSALPDPPSGTEPQRNLRRELGAPEEHMDATVWRLLQGLAEAVEKYEAIPADQLVLKDPGRPSKNARDNTEVMRNRKFFGNTTAQVQGIHDTIQSIREYFNPPAGAAKPYPASISNIIAANISVLDANALVAASRSIPDSGFVRRFVSGLVGGDLMESKKYKEKAETKEEPGLAGPDACDKILGEYIRRVGGVNEDTAKEGLMWLTGRVKAAVEEIRIDQKRFAEVHAERDEAAKIKAFNNKHKEGRTRGLWSSNVHARFLAELDDHHHGVGIENPEQDHLEDVKTRYYTLWHLTHANDDKRLPMTEKLAKELTNLRRVIVRRQLQSTHVWTLKNGLDVIKKEDAEKLGLRGTNAEYIPFKTAQYELFERLDKTEMEPAMKAKVEEKIHHAWERIEGDKQYRKAKADEWKTGPWYSWRRIAGEIKANPGTALSVPVGAIGGYLAASAVGSTWLTVGAFAPGALIAGAAGAVAAPYAWKGIKWGWSKFTGFASRTIKSQFDEVRFFGEESASHGHADEHAGSHH